MRSLKSYPEWDGQLILVRRLIHWFRRLRFGRCVGWDHDDFMITASFVKEAEEV